MVLKITCSLIRLLLIGLHLFYLRFMGLVVAPGDLGENAADPDQNDNQDRDQAAC